MITHTCPHCGHQLRVPEEYAGRTGKCKNCQKTVTIPAQEEAKFAPKVESAHEPELIDEESSGVLSDHSKRKGKTRACPYCGEQILRSAKKCRYCGEFLKGQKELKTNVQQGALIGSIACFTIGVCMIWWQPLLFIIYIPLLLASFVLSITAMAQGRVLGGIVMLVLTVVIPVLVVLVGLLRVAVSASDAMKDAKSEDLGLSTPATSHTTVPGEGTATGSLPTTTASIDVDAQRLFKEKQEYMEFLDLYDFQARYYESLLDGNVPGVEFKIRNRGSRTLREVEVTVYFRDAWGNTIAEEDYHPVLVSEYSFGDNKPLKPNYIWQMEHGSFYKAPSVPSEWQEGNAIAQITDIEFAGKI